MNDSMTLFILTAAVLTLVTIGLIVWPLWRAGPQRSPLAAVLAACLNAQLQALPPPVQAQLRTARLHALAAQPAERLQSPTSICADST